MPDYPHQDMNPVRRATFLIFACVGVVILMSLSGWQFQRLLWKQQLLIDLHDRVAKPAVPLSNDVRQMTPMQLRFTHLQVNGQVNYQQYLLQPGRNKFGKAGMKLLIPVVTDYGWLLVNFGVIDHQEIDNWQADLPVAQQDINVVGIAQPVSTTTPQRHPWFIPRNRSEQNIWFTIDINKMATRIGLDPATALPLVLLAEAVMPHPAVTPTQAWHTNIRNDHLQYAITWLLLAIGLAILAWYWMRAQRQK